jgi:hypothetical protein
MFDLASSIIVLVLVQPAIVSSVVWLRGGWDRDPCWVLVDALGVVVAALAIVNVR